MFFTTQRFKKSITIKMRKLITKLLKLFNFQSPSLFQRFWYKIISAYNFRILREDDLVQSKTSKVKR